MKKIGKLYILGDSYSTFYGYVPPFYASWYSSFIDEKTDVFRVEDTWWQRLLAQTDSELLMNDSYSGTTICNTTYEGKYCPTASFIGRFDRLIGKGYFDAHMPDTVLIFGGTNDCWAGSPLGELQYSGWTDDDLRRVLPAVCYLLHQVTGTLTDSKIVFVVNSDLDDGITEGIVAACEHYGVPYVRLKDIGKMSGHPDKAGMAAICEQVLEVL